MNAGVIIFVLLLVLAFLGLPIYLSIGIATMVAMVHAGFPLEAIAQKTFLGMNSSSLLCIPLFILAGNINSAGTLGQVFLSRQIILNEQRQQGNAAQRGRDASEQRHAWAHRCSAGSLRSSGAHLTKTQKRQSTPFCYPARGCL